MPNDQQPTIQPAQSQPQGVASGSAPLHTSDLFRYLGLAILVAVLLGGAYLYARFHRVASPQSAVSAIDDISTLVKNGSYADAAQRAKQVAAETTDPAEKLSAERLQAYSLFMTGGTSDQIEAVKLTKDLYVQDALSGDRARQARDINRILQFATVSRDKDVFNEVFTGPFAAYKVGDDFGLSMAKLAEYSYSLYPSTVSLFVTAWPHLWPLTNFDKQYTLTKEEKKVHADALLGILQGANELYPREASVETQSLLNPVTFNYLEGVNYAAVARVYPAYLQNMEVSFQRILDYYNAKTDENGNHYVLIESRLPMTHLTWAAALLRSGGEQRRVDVEKHLDAIISMVSANPSHFENQFIPLLKRTATEKAINQGNSFTLLAKAYKPFADFIAQYGITVTQ